MKKFKRALVQMSSGNDLRANVDALQRTRENATGACMPAQSKPCARLDVLGGSSEPLKQRRLQHTVRR